MPDEPVEQEPTAHQRDLQASLNREVEIEEGHPAAGAAYEEAIDHAEAREQAAEARAMMAEARVDEIREGPPPAGQEVNPVTGMWQTVPFPQSAPAPEPAETATQPPLKLEDVERVIRYLDHRTFLGNGTNFDRLVVIRHVNNGYMKHDSLGRKRWVKNIENAQRYEVVSGQVQGGWQWGDENYEVLLLKELPILPGCVLGDWFDKRFITLIVDAPNNLVTRAHMMRVLKVEPPRELDTFEKLRDWVESTFPKPRKKSVGPVPSPSTDWRAVEDLVRPAPPTTRPVGSTLLVEYSLKMTEYGRCQYHVRKTRRQTFELDMETIHRMIQDHGVDNLAALDGQIRREIWEQEMEDWDYGDMQTEDLEESTTDNHETRPVGEFPGRAIADFIRRHDPELADRFNPLN